VANILGFALPVFNFEAGFEMALYFKKMFKVYDCFQK